MRCLTLYQPWASLVAVGAKRVETRSWATEYRGPLAIHAAARKPTDDEWDQYNVWIARGWAPRVSPLPLGCVVAVCRKSVCVPTESVRVVPDLAEPLYAEPVWGSPAGVLVISEQEAAFGNYSPGRWAWFLPDVRPLTPPVEARGARGLWEWEERSDG